MRPSSSPTIPPTVWPPRCGRRTCTAPTGSPRVLRPGMCGSTPTASSRPRCHSADSSTPGSAARTACTRSTSTSRRRPCGSSSPEAPAIPSPSAERRRSWGTSGAFPAADETADCRSLASPCDNPAAAKTAMPKSQRCQPRWRADGCQSGRLVHRKVVMRAEEEEAFDAFVRARGEYFLRVSVLLTGSVPEGEDLLQTSLVRLYRVWPRLDNGRDGCGG